MNLENWYKNRKTALYIFLVITIILLYSGRNIRFGNYTNENGISCCIEFSCSNLNCSNMEKEVTIPLESKINEIPYLSEIRSVIEENKSSTYLYFDEKADRKKTYFEISKITDEVYGAISYPLRKPRIYFDNNENFSDFVFAIFENNDEDACSIQRELVETIESLDEVSQLEIYGKTDQEVKINLNEDLDMNNKISPQDISLIIQKNNPCNSSLLCKSNITKERINIISQVKSFEQWKELSIKKNKQPVKLSSLCNISYAAKAPGEIVKLNGKNCIEIEVKAKNNSDCIGLSKKCRQLLKNRLSENEYAILQDAGKDQQDKIKRVLFALLQGIILIFIIIPFLFKDIRIVAALIIFMIVSLFLSFLFLGALSISINQQVICGICISLGLIIDPAIIISEQKLKSSTTEIFIKKIKSVLPSLITSAGTNLIVFIPFFFVEKLIPGISEVVKSIILMTFVSFFIAIVFFPIFLMDGKFIIHKNDRLEKSVSQLKLKKKKCLCIYVLMICFSSTAFLILDKDSGFSYTSNLISVDIEFNPEKRKEIIDESISPLVSFLMEKNFTENVISICNKGNCQLKIKFNQKNINKSELIKLVPEIKNRVKEGRIFINDGIYKKNPGFSIEIAVEGENSMECRNLANELAEKLYESKKVTSVVLNFKELEKICSFNPERNIIDFLGSSPVEIGQNIYWQICNPVIDKYWENNREYDVIISNQKNEAITFEDFLEKRILIGDDIFKIRELGSMSFMEDLGKLYRKNNQSCAFLTVYFEKSNTKEAVKIIRDSFAKLKKTDSYTYSIDRKTMEREEIFKTIFLSFVFAVILLYIFICGINERPYASVAILSIVPASFAIPFAVKLILNSCLGAGDFLGMSLAAGIVVNNAIIIQGQGLKNNSRGILVTNLTTILGSIPILICEESGLSKDLSFYLLFSSIGALLLAFIIFPQIISFRTSVRKDFLQGS